MALLAACAALVACSRPARAAAPRSGAGRPPPGAARPQAIVSVLYRPPADTAVFERYYREKHLPLLSAGQAEMGFTRVELTRFVSTLGGGRPPFYRQAELYFTSLEDARKGLATAAFKKVAADLDNFDTRGRLAMLAVETDRPAGAACPALVAVLYGAPKDTAAFEAHYAKAHLPLVSAGRREIGFVRLDLTRFLSNLDGSAPAMYRQAELCFRSMAALKQGVATGAFKRVTDDVAGFATGGSVGLIGVQQ